MGNISARQTPLQRVNKFGTGALQLATWEAYRQLQSAQGEALEILLQRYRQVDENVPENLQQATVKRHQEAKQAEQLSLRKYGEALAREAKENPAATDREY